MFTKCAPTLLPGPESHFLLDWMIGMPDFVFTRHHGLAETEPCQAGSVSFRIGHMVVFTHFLP